MIFFVNVAVIIENDIQNIRFQFPALPALREISAAVLAHFHPLRISDSTCLLDEYAHEWIALYSAAQLTTDCQILFLPHELRDATAVRPERIPPATQTVVCRAVSLPLPPCDITNEHFAHVHVRPNDAACRTCAVFDALDAQRKGYLSYADVCRAVEAQRVIFSNYSADALFARLTGGRGNCIRFGQWAEFAATQPATIHALFAALPQSAREKKRMSRDGDAALERTRSGLAYVEARLAPDASVATTVRWK